MAGLASKLRPLARTLHAIRASLLASAIARTLRCSRFEALCQRRVTAVYSGGYATLCYQRECSIGARRSPATAKIRVFIIPRTVGALALAILRAGRSRVRLSAPPATVRRRCSVGVVAVAAPRGDRARLTEVVLIVRRSSGASKTPEDGTATGAGGDAARTPDRG